MISAACRPAPPSSPADDLGYGFDSIGDALTFSTLHLEHYLSAAGAVAAAVFDGEDPLHPTRRRFAAGSMRVVANPGAVRVGDVLHMVSRATVQQAVTLPRAGVYALRLFAGADQAGDGRRRCCCGSMAATWTRSTSSRRRCAPTS